MLSRKTYFLHCCNCKGGPEMICLLLILGCKLPEVAPDVPFVFYLIGWALMLIIPILVVVRRVRIGRKRGYDKMIVVPQVIGYILTFDAVYSVLIAYGVCPVAIGVVGVFLLLMNILT